MRERAPSIRKRAILRMRCHGELRFVAQERANHERGLSTRERALQRAEHEGEGLSVRRGPIRMRES